MLKIDEKFRIVLPIKYSEDGSPSLRVYHTPIRREVFEANYRIISATFSALMSPAARAGAMRIATLRLRDEGERDARERGFDPQSDGGASALLGEIKRLSLVLVPEGEKWEMVPVDVAIEKGFIDDDDWRDAESALVFFTCLFNMVTKHEKARMVEAAASMMNASITSLAPLEFADSCTASIPIPNIQMIT